MEAIGVGANVLAFVVLGIKSAKLAHDTLSAIKDGPALVQNVAASFLQLHWILEQLRQCRAAATDTALHCQARHCCEELDKLAKIIERLQVPPREKATGRFWKRLKAAISENDLKRLDAWVAQQASMLSLRLNVLSSNEIYATRGGNERIQQQINSFSASMQTQFESQTATIRDAAMSITSSHNDGRSALEAGLSSIKQTIEATHSISSENTLSMAQILKEIKDHIIPESKDDPETSNPSGDDGDATGEAAIGLDQKLLESIDSLCSLIDEKRDAVDAYGEDDDQAQSAIENLDKLVKNLREKKLPISDPKSFGSDLGRFSKWFGSGTLSINSGIETSRKPLTRVIEQSRSCIKADIGAGKVHFIVQKRKRALGTSDQDDDDTTAKKRCHTDWMMTVAYLPDRVQDRHMFLASLTRRELFANRMTCVSRLQVNRVLPAESPVFQLVKLGDLRGLKEMLQDGRASLRDHDEYGASLLFYSVQQPETCKFLLDSGLDVDHVANDLGCNEYRLEGDNIPMRHVLQTVPGDDADMEPEEFRRVTECRKLLLRAGADPTLTLGRYSFLDKMSGEGAPESIRLVWSTEIVAPFADIKTYRSPSGRSSLLVACENTGHGYTKERFDQLLQLGANIQDRDKHGRTCLHICLVNIGALSHDQSDAIEYLLQKGADPCAVDNYGLSVSDIAYTTHGSQKIHSSLPGDIWDAVLHKCGYDISQFRPGYQRRARYTTPAHNRRTGLEYNRQAFENLWKGREAECPYWDDKPWPPLGPGEEDSDEESPGLECRCIKCRPVRYIFEDEGEFESGSEYDTGEDEEQASSNDGGPILCQSCLRANEEEEQSESGMGESMSTEDVESDWEETGTLPGFGELMQDTPSENWQDFPDLGHSIFGTARSLSMDLENPWR